VLFPGVQYYTGQFFDLKAITRAAHGVGAYAGFDLAHAIGNLPMQLHDDQVDFAVWCSYKYLNSGPGNVSGIYIHEKHGNRKDFPRLTGWWGQNEKTRFQMDNQWDPNPGVDGWMLSNVNVLATSIHLGALEVFDNADIHRLREKSIKLTGFLEFLLQDNGWLNSKIKLLTPSHPQERGCQLSLYFPEHGKKVFEFLSDNAVILDWREPNVIRVAPTPLYNTFEEVYRFSELLKTILDQS
jgi:kynureninase